MASDEAGSEAASADALAQWRAAFGLERWFFIARGSGQQVTPFAVDADGAGTICVFTSPEGASRFGVSMGLSEQEAGYLMAVPSTGAVDYLVQFAADGVSTLVLDPGTGDAAVMLAALPHVQELARSEQGEPPPAAG